MTEGTGRTAKGLGRLTEGTGPASFTGPQTVAIADGRSWTADRFIIAVGGHAAVAGDILEDVALARAVKSTGRKIRFRYAADAVRTRMYRNYAQLREGWTKNLALLFPKPGWLATQTVLFWAFPFANLLLPLFVPAVVHRAWWFVPGGLVFARNTGRMRRANFDLTMEIMGALFGMPMFAYLLLRSKRAHANGNVAWKGRTYSDKPSTDKPASEKAAVLATGH